MSQCLYLVESSEQIAGVKSAWKTGDIALAFDGVVHRALAAAGLESHRIDELYSHAEFWARYPGTNEISRRIVKTVSSALQDAEIEGADFFSRFYHTVRIATDQFIHFSFLIRRAIGRWPDAEIVCGECGPVRLDNAGLFLRKDDVLARVVKAMGVAHRTAALREQQGDGGHRHQLTPTTFSFGQPKAWLRPLAERFKNRKAIWDLSRAGESRILSVSCRELNLLADELDGLAVIPYQKSIELQQSRSCPAAITKILSELEEHRVFNIEEPYGINLAELLLPGLSLYCSNLPRLAGIARRLARDLDNMKIDVVVVPTLSELHLPAALTDHVAGAMGIPVVCWMHGGYGAYPSLPGYEETDYRLGKHHIIYGEAVKDCIEDENSVLRALGIGKDLNLSICGTPYLERLYEGAPESQDAKLQNKPKIVLTIGSIHQRNHFYFGYNRPYNELSCFDAHVRIIEALAPFSDRYHIVIKDYPDANPDRLAVWADLIRKYPDVEVIAAEQSFSSAIRDASAVVHVWVSTTFVETLLTKADILLFDDSEMTARSREMFGRDIVFRDDLEQFTQSLRSYLSAGVFGTQDKSGMRDYFAAARGGESKKVIASYLQNLAAQFRQKTTAY
jgi:hypothetical protein